MTKPIRATLWRFALALAVGILVAGVAAARAHGYDPLQPWLLEGSVGTIQAGPNGESLGAGQTYAVHAGYQWVRGADVAFTLARSDARDTGRAVETSVTSGGLRLRGWVSGGRWSPYAEAGTRLYFFEVEEMNVLAPLAEHDLLAGGHLGGGILYARSTWWLGLGAEVHAAFGKTDWHEDEVVNYATYHLFAGRSFAW